MARGYRSLVHAARVAGLLAGCHLTGAGAAAAQTAQSPAIRDVAAELACGPRATETLPPDPLRVAGGATAGKVLFGTGETVVVRGGAARGLEPGQRYFVRRAVADRFTAAVSDGIALHSIHTAGWIRIDAVRPDSAVATVAHSCDALMEGDYLEPFEMPVVPAASARGAADYENPGRLILGDERRQVGSAGSLMVLDRGSDHGLHPGQRVTLFRHWPAAGPVVRLGEATAVLVYPETATLRIDETSDAIYVGDLAAIQR